MASPTKRGRRGRGKQLWSSDWRGSPRESEMSRKDGSRSPRRALAEQLEGMSLDREPLVATPTRRDWEVPSRGMAATPCPGCDGEGGRHGGPRCRIAGQQGPSNQSQETGRTSEAAETAFKVFAAELVGVHPSSLSCGRCARTRKGENAGSTGERHTGGPGCARSGRDAAGRPLKGGKGKVAAAAERARAEDAAAMRAAAIGASAAVVAEEKFGGTPRVPRETGTLQGTEAEKSPGPVGEERFRPNPQRRRGEASQGHSGGGAEERGRGHADWLILNAPFLGGGDNGAGTDQRSRGGGGGGGGGGAQPMVVEEATAGQGADGGETPEARRRRTDAGNG